MNEVVTNVRGGDVCVFMGAGDIDAVARRVLAALQGGA
jgi:UDP-N-acetylmuramate-alanine ligase